MPDALSAGRVPQQSRAIARREALLDAAADVLLAHEHLVMSSVAVRAGVSIGSLYQYFPSPGALLRALAERHLAAGRALLVDLDVSGDPLEALDGALAAYLRVADDARAVAVMRAIRADPALRALDRADTERNAATALATLGVDDAGMLTRLTLVIELAGASILLSADEPPERRALLHDAFRTMARAAVAG